jgi:hypothetical protein
MSVPAAGQQYDPQDTLKASGTYSAGWTVDNVHIIYEDETGTTVTLNPAGGLSQANGAWSASFNLPNLDNWEFLCAVRAHQGSTKDNVDHYFSTGTAPL